MALTGEQLRAWLHEQLEIACEQIRQDIDNNDEVSALVHRGEMHAVVRVLRHAVDGVDMGAVFDLVAVTVGEADFHISELEQQAVASADDDDPPADGDDPPADDPPGDDDADQSG